ncbi:MAG TPA: gamma-glutamyltransferase [Thermotogota bacterium]|nr:gamma-glutamyltransferase [Thermotogota bacterium]
MKKSVLCIIVFFMIVSIAFSAITAQTVASSKGMVSAASSYAAEVGAQILEKGGNAIDAAIAVSFALGVVEPYASSLGGEGYAVITMANGEKYAIDFKSMVPANLTYEKLKELGTTLSKSKYTAKGALIPGVVAGIQKIYDLGATLPIEDLLAPSIKLARDGFIVNETFASVTADAYEKLLESAPEYLKDMLLWETGDLFKNEAIAQTYEMLAENGLDCFYNGQIAEDLAAYMEENEGFITKEDLANYRALVSTPLHGTYRGYDLYTTGSPVSGPQLLAVLNILENFNLGLMGAEDPLAIHIIQQALVLADVDRRFYISDPVLFDLPIDGFISKEFARVRMLDLDLNKAMDPKKYFDKVGDAYPFEEGKTFEDVMLSQLTATAKTQEDVHESPSTTHFSVVDKDGNAVAWTQTLSSFYGTCSFVDGFFLNNEIGNFAGSYREGDVINLAPGMKPRTTICPTVIQKDGKVKYVIGTPGGARIISTVTELIVDLIDFGMTIDEAVSMPKFVGYAKYSDLPIEEGMPEKTIEVLKAMGHDVSIYSYPDLYFGGPNVIAVEDSGMMIGAGSIRRNGAASAPEL